MRRSRWICSLTLALAAGVTQPAFAAGLQGGVVLCAAMQTASTASGARKSMHPIGDGRLLAPTRPAIFLSREGGRCAWPARTRLAG